MDFPLSRALVPGLDVRESSPSTNTELVARARAQSLVHFSTLVTLDQTAGRGRIGRSWQAPAGSALACSVYLAPQTDGGAPLPLARFGWFALVAGVAMTETVRHMLGLASSLAGSPAASVGFKWPNDVLIGADGRKVSGILAELVPERSALVIGAGLNLDMTEAQLPVTTATSLLVESGTSYDPDTVLAGYLARLREHADAFASAGGEADASGLRDRARALCSTLGRSVRVELPDGTTLDGTATDLDADGRLEVRTGDGATVAVSAGDVTHLRHL